MTAAELIAALVAADPRRDYYIRHTMANVFDAGGRLEMEDTFRLIIAPGFRGARKCVVEGASWQDIADGPEFFCLKSATTEPLP